MSAKLRGPRLNAVGLAVFCCALISGCASEVVRSSASLVPVVESESMRIEILQDVEVKSSSGYSRLVQGGSRWQMRGSLPQGQVYRRINGVFTVEGANVHEAYLVLAGDQLVGFYLPVEKAYSACIAVSIKYK